MTTSITTRKGDDGTTGLMFGPRVAKDHPRIEAVGCFDELNASLGLAKACAIQTANDSKSSLPALVPVLEAIQKQLISLMGELATSEDKQQKYLESSYGHLQEGDLHQLDQAIADLEAKKLSYDGWATPGATELAARLDWARVIARRAERQLVHLQDVHLGTVRGLVLQYTNRLSDLLWLLAREEEQMTFVQP